ncbi:NAD-dependent epimerase/dehydratase family protein [Nannocystaceae bacterium ST9]
MTTSRRRFTSLAGLGLLAGAIGCDRKTASEVPEAKPRAREPGKPLHILVLGGTGFLGPHFVEAALAKGHTLTLFNRGKTNPHLFPELEKLHGDRKTGDLKALEGRVFDAVVDNSGYLPKHVTQSAELLKTSGQYLFVSSVSAFRDQGKPGLKESDPVAPLTEPDTQDVMAHYGALKAACEQAAEAVMPGRVSVVRPGLIVGPGDESDRFTYWPVRLARGGEVLAPGNPDDPVQLIDVRDLAAFMLRCVENELTEVYSAVGPNERLSVQGMLEGCIAALGSSATLTWADAEFLASQAVEPWMQMTVWVPPGSEFGGLGAVDGSAAWAAGLVNRPIGEIAKDTLDWWNAQSEERRKQPRAGLPAEREVEVLAAWHARSSDETKRASAS